MIDRTWDPPGRHWPDRPQVLAGRDKLAGGSWFGRNDHGVFSAVLNREGSLGPTKDKRSRGELVLDALDHSNANEAAKALRAINPDSYRGFNLVIGDNTNIFHIANRAGEKDLSVENFPGGLSMLTSQEINDQRNARIKTFLPMFQDAEPPDPENGNWAAWQTILSNNNYDPAFDPTAAMCITSDWGFGTVSSTLLALPELGAKDIKGIYLFAAGQPDRTEYHLI